MNITISNEHSFPGIAERIVNGEPIDKVTVGTSIVAPAYKIVCTPPCNYSLYESGPLAAARKLLRGNRAAPETDKLRAMLAFSCRQKRTKLENQLSRVKGIAEGGEALGKDLSAGEKAMLEDMLRSAKSIAAAGQTFSSELVARKQAIKEERALKYPKPDSDMPPNSPEARAATTLQARIRKARHLTSDAEKENLANKKTIEQHMQWIQRNVLFSYSAHLVNARPDIAAIKVAKGVKERQFEQTMLDNGAGCSVKSYEYEGLRAHLRHQVSQDGYDKVLELYVGHLSHKLRAKALVCDDMARLVALRIRNDPSLPEALRKETRVCRMGSHIMCCVGKPSNLRSLIVDPWSYYLDYVPKAPDGDQSIDKAATRLVEAQMGERGFLGTVEQYREFIGQRPSLIGSYPEVDGSDPRRNEKIQVADYNIEVDPIGQYIVENMLPEHIAQINLALPEGEELKLMAHWRQQ